MRPDEPRRVARVVTADEASARLSWKFPELSVVYGDVASALSAALDGDVVLVDPRWRWTVEPAKGAKRPLDLVISVDLEIAALGGLGRARVEVWSRGVVAKARLLLRRLDLVLVNQVADRIRVAGSLEIDDCRIIARGASSARRGGDAVIKIEARAAISVRHSVVFACDRAASCGVALDALAGPCLITGSLISCDAMAQTSLGTLSPLK